MVGSLLKCLLQIQSSVEHAEASAPFDGYYVYLAENRPAAQTTAEGVVQELEEARRLRIQEK